MNEGQREKKKERKARIHANNARGIYAKKGGRPMPHKQKPTPTMR